MNWYKKAKLSKKEEEIESAFAQWWQKQTSGHDARSIQFLLSKNDLSIEDLKDFLANIVDKSNINIFDAVGAAHEYFKERKEKMMQEKEQKKRDKYMKVMSDEEIAKTELVGKDCFLNGYPAKVEANKFGKPVIISPHSYTGNTEGNRTDYINPYWSSRTWINTKKYFPNFFGGKLYDLNDSEEIIAKRIEKEKQRPPYPSQSNVLRVLKEREKQVVEKSTTFTFDKNDPSPTTKTRFKAYDNPSMPLDEYVRKRETGRTPQ